MTLDEIGPGSLKLIVCANAAAAERLLQEHVAEHHIRPAGEGAWVIFTQADPATVRDWLVAPGRDPSSALVVEFEHWSGYGDIDQPWLLRRGH